jgi:putative FmdB family regulatory protein
MPIYEYRCQSCGGKNEFLQKMDATADGLVCKTCGSKELQKVISAHCGGKCNSHGSSHSCGSGGCCGGACGV